LVSDLISPVPCISNFFFGQTHVHLEKQFSQRRRISVVDVYAGCSQQQVVSALMSQPGFHLSCIDYLLGFDTPAAAAATPSDDDNSFSFIACTLPCSVAFVLLCHRSDYSLVDKLKLI